jgi:hypothetical protein
MTIMWLSVPRDIAAGMVISAFLLAIGTPA